LYHPTFNGVSFKVEALIVILNMPIGFSLRWVWANERSECFRSFVDAQNIAAKKRVDFIYPIQF
jgi:hypothetical protein